MNEPKIVLKSTEYELIDLLLDFIIVSAKLAKRISQATPEKQSPMVKCQEAERKKH